MKTLTILTILLIYILQPQTSKANPKPWEVSFGNTQVFSGWYNEDISYVPTSSSTLILSYKISDHFALWTIGNIPLSPNQEVTEDGIVVRNITLPTLMLGVSYEPIAIEIYEKTILGLDIGASIGRELTLDGRIFPIGASRIKVVVDNSNSAYLGLTTSPYNADGDLIFGLVYGVGMRF